MKKLIIASIMATAALAASAQVSLTGKVSEWVDNTKTGNSARVTGVTTEPTSNIAIGVKENLGSGLSVRAVVETSINGNTVSGTGTQLGDRQRTVGLANRFGSVDLGRNVHSQFLAVTNNDAFGTLYGSVAGDVHNLRGLRFDQGAYVAVNPIKGVTVTADRDQAAGAQANAYSAGLSVGPANATVARYTAGAESSNVYAANAKFGPTQVFYSFSDNKGLVNSKGNLVGVRYQLSAPVAIKASYGETNHNVKAYSLGADYALSKKAEVGVAYRNVNLAGTTNDVKQIGAGLTYRF